MSRATVITDASFCRKTKMAGWAAWVRIDGQSAPIKQAAAFRGPVTTSVMAEMLAVINGIWLASQHGATFALVQTDCLTVVHMLNGVTKRPDLRHAFQTAIAQAGISDITIEGRHVKGHTTVSDARSYVNRWCDAQAKRAMRAQRGHHELRT